MNILKMSVPVIASALLAGCAAEPVPTPAAPAQATPAVTTSVTTAPVTVTVTAPPAVEPPQVQDDSAPAACTDTDLVVYNRPLESQGSEYRLVVLFENTSAKACTLQGYPGADIVDVDLPVVHAERRQQIAAPLLTLQPGEIATADLQSSDVNRETESPCGNWGQVVVIAPNTFQQRHLDIGLPMCSALISSVT